VRAGAFVLGALTAPLLLGCGTTPTLHYKGSASLQASGAAAADLAADELVVTHCRELDPASGYHVDVAYMEIGGRCMVRGRWDAASFRFLEAGRCTLGHGEHERAVKVTDVVARYSTVPVEPWGRSSQLDASTLDVTLGADAIGSDGGPGAHEVYHFYGTVSDHEPPRCNAIAPL